MVALVLALAALAAPPPDAPFPRTAAGLRAAYAQTTRDLDAALDRWGSRGAIPRDVGLDALYQERIVRFVAATPRFAAALPAARDDVLARRDLLRLAAPYPARLHVRIGRPPAPAALLGWYRAAERRFGVPWSILAAVNFVESRFGTVQNDSVAGAQGPMQFLPATWRRYGLGGDVHDPHDAILGAANMLAADGAAHDPQRALLAYNHSPLYVDAVTRYARRIRNDRHAFLGYYAWPVFIRTASGVRRVTGPR